MSKDLQHTNYNPGKPDHWSGRKISESLGVQYWYQAVVCKAISELKNLESGGFGLLGYACDEGVKRNQGRVGAVEGPKVLRGKLGKVAWHHETKTVYDFGTVLCKDSDLEACRETFSESIANMISNRIFPIGLGGGHDMAYAHFMGIKKACENQNKRIGIINFDAHFDLRPIEESPNSGTPFNQINSVLKKENKPFDYFVLGIQKGSNTKQLFEIAKAEQVKVVYAEECLSDKSSLEAIKSKLNAFIASVDTLYITIDLDGFSSAYAPGVSAPSPLGFSPDFVFNILGFLLNSEKVIALDIAELNPKYDRDGQTAILASRLVDFVVGNAPRSL
ncbi:formimidoylglutamase [Gaetbulibacter aestuarii]|uniref:Formimidoylglutamase n=1 Tax=Gaetbulibacter aestuarii TaxID=1502358 RepID=A0ABW7N314_9FLAO